MYVPVGCLLNANSELISRRDEIYVLFSIQCNSNNWRKPGIIKLTVSLLDWHFAMHLFHNFFYCFKCGKKIDKIENAREKCEVHTTYSTGCSFAPR